MAAPGCCVPCLEPKDHHSPDLDHRLPTLEAGGSNLGRADFANRPGDMAGAGQVRRPEPEVVILEGRLAAQFTLVIHHCDRPVIGAELDDARETREAGGVRAFAHDALPYGRPICRGAPNTNLLSLPDRITHFAPSTLAICGACS